MYKQHYLVAIFFIITGLQACQNSPGNKPVQAAAFADSIQINKLIIKGHDRSGGRADTLLTIAKQIDSLSDAANSKIGPIYADVFRARYYWMASKYPEAMGLALKALGDAEHNHISQPIPEIYIIIANLHSENDNYQDAFSDCDKGLSAAKANRDTASIISVLGVKAWVTGQYYQSEGKKDTVSLPLEFQALAMAESQPKYENMRIRFYDIIAQDYTESKQYDKAVQYAQKGVVLASKYHQARSLTYAYNWLGEAYYYLGQRDTGITYLKRAINLTRQLKQPYREMELYDAMSKCFLSTKNYEPAITAMNRSTKMRDSLQIAKNEKQITELQLKYNAGGKDKQIALLNDLNKLKAQKILRITVAMICFVILMVVILYQYYTIHRYSRLMEGNNRQLNNALLKIAHIQSHQIRKPLASILGLMNIIKSNNYEADKEVLQKMDEVAQELDKQIREVISQTEVGD